MGWRENDGDGDDDKIVLELNETKYKWLMDLGKGYMGILCTIFATFPSIWNQIKMLRKTI